MQILFFILGALALISGVLVVFQTHPAPERPVAHRQFLCSGGNLPAGPRRVHRRHPGDRLCRGHHGAVPLCHHAPEPAPAGGSPQDSLIGQKWGASSWPSSPPCPDVRRSPGEAARRPRKWRPGPGQHRIHCPEPVHRLPAALRSHLGAAPGGHRGRGGPGEEKAEVRIHGDNMSKIPLNPPFSKGDLRPPGIEGRFTNRPYCGVSFVPPFLKGGQGDYSEPRWPHGS